MSKVGTTKKSMAKSSATIGKMARGRDVAHPRATINIVGGEKRLPLKKGQWSEFDQLDDKQIEQAIAEDPDAAPILDDSFWDEAKVVMPVPKQAISIRIDEDVLAYFKDFGPGYQSRISAVLRSYVEANKVGK